MTITVTTDDTGTHRALVTGYTPQPVTCCEHGHPDAPAAGRHAWALAAALARYRARPAVTP